MLWFHLLQYPWSSERDYDIAINGTIASVLPGDVQRVNESTSSVLPDDLYRVNRHGGTDDVVSLTV
jgi:hypothetical protein